MHTNPDARAQAEASTAAHNRRTDARPDGYRHRTPGIDFAENVADGGYLWWYVDAISDDGSQSLTMIIFVGSVFSPYYARARKRGSAPAENHCAFNTILYGPGGRKRWSMTERSAASLERSRDRYSLGPSQITREGDCLVAEINERSVPLPRKMQGNIRITPSAFTGHSLRLDAAGRHYWNPIAPIARVDVNFPGLGTCWSGDGYLDSNNGDEPLADGFSDWDWTRARLGNGDCAIRYEARHPMRDAQRLALRFGADGTMTSEAVREAQSMPRTPVWQVTRRMPGCEEAPVIKQTVEDTPFYARSVIEGRFNGERGVGFHESLDMRRFERRWVQTLLPFRMPRFA